MANVNETSTRYSEAIDSVDTTLPGEWRVQSKDNKQGSNGFLPEDLGRSLSDAETALQRHARATYEERLALGVAREQARKDLPLSTYTEAVWKIDLHNLLHFLRLRMAPDAQLEIRSYAKLIGEKLVAAWVPHTWQAFLDFRKNAVTFSAIEYALLGALVRGDVADATAIAAAAGYGIEKSSEATRAATQLRALGFPVPWKETI